MKVLLLTLVVLFFSLPSSSQTTKVCQGIVKIEYSLDTIGLDRYWFVQEEFNGMQLIKDIDDVGFIDFDSIDMFLFATPKGGMTVYQLPEYRDQASNDTSSFYQHIGGDLYLDSARNIIIAFEVLAKVIIFESEPYVGFYSPSKYSCPVKKKKIVYPLVSLLSIESSNSVSLKTIKDNGWVKYVDRTFPLGICD